VIASHEIKYKSYKNLRQWLPMEDNWRSNSSKYTETNMYLGTFIDQ
jgi:hypothetical protein